MHFRSFVPHKDLNPEIGVVPKTRANSNGTEEVSHANVSLG